MIKCTLDGKTYTVDMVTGRVLRESDEASRMLNRMMRITHAASTGSEISEADNVSVAEAMDVFVKWFCVLFGNQFTPDDVYDHYPSDSFMHDVTYALTAVLNRASSALSEFPMKAAKQEKAQAPEN